MRDHFLKTLICLAFFAGMAVTAEVGAQEAEREDVFVAIVDVDVVEVNVHVTDHSGQPVYGLTVEDFEVLDDGVPVEITNFREVSRRPVRRVESGGRSDDAGPVDSSAQGPAPENGAPVVDSTTELDESPLHLVLYIDNVNIKRTHRQRVLANVRQLVLGLQVPPRIMVVSYDRSLKVRQPFTTDLTSVNRALLALEETPTFGDTSDDVFRDLLREMEDRNARQAWLEGRVVGFAEEVRHGLERSLGALRGVVDDLAGLPGRKALIYVSDGLPLTPAEELFHALEKRFLDLTALHHALRFDSGRDFQRLTQVANTAGVTFYTVHAAGLEAPLTSDAEIAGSGYDELRATVDSVRTANLQGSGRVLASETGGLALLNQNDFSAGLRRVAEDFSHHYSLGFNARQSDDGRYHRIEVKVEGKGLEVRHRRGYRAQTVATRMSESVRSAVTYGYGRNPFGVDLAVGSPAPETGSKRGETHVVPIRVAIPMGNIVMIEIGDSYQGRLLLYVAVQDASGGLSPVQEIEVPVEVPSTRIEEALAQSWVQEIQLRMRPGRHLLAVGVRDEIGHTSSIAFERFSVD